MGDQVWFIALAWAAARATDPATAGIIVGAGTVPRMLALLPAGVIVDRFGALRIAQSAQLVRVATMLGAIMVAVAEVATVPALLALALIFGLADALRLPAAGALPPALVSADELPQAQGVVSAVGRTAAVFAGPIAGFALAVGGLTAVAAVNAALFAAAFAAFAALRKRATAQAQSREKTDRSGLVAGLRYVARETNILLMLSMTAALNLALVGPLNLGIVLRVEEEGWSPVALGLIIGTFGVAAAFGALTLSVYRPRRRPVVAGFAWSALSAAAIATLGLAPTIATTAVAAAVAGVALGPAGALLLGGVQIATGPEYMGRVMSLISFSSFGLTPLGLSAFGYLANTVGLPFAFLITGGTVAALALSGALMPTLRHLRVSDSGQERAA